MIATTAQPLAVCYLMTDRSDTPAAPWPAAATDAAENSVDLLLRAKGGDSEALNRLCAIYLPRLKRWAHGRLPVSARGLLDTQDLVQEVLVHAVNRIAAFEPRHDGAFGAYVRQALLNRVRDEGRKGTRRPTPAPLDDNLIDDKTSPLENAIGRQALERYDAALARLKPHERELIIAKLELGFSAAEIATEFGRPTPAAAQMAVSRAMVRLAEEMTRG